VARGEHGRPGRDQFHLTKGAAALLALAALSTVLWLVGHNAVNIAVTTAILVALAVDFFLARAAVHPVTLQVHSVDEVPVGVPIPWTVRVVGWRRPVSVASMIGWTTPDLLVSDGQPGVVWSPPMPRGLVRFVLFDTKASGPLGLVSAGKRHLVPLPTPVAITPRPSATTMRWPRSRAVHFGLAEGAPIGDETFRSVRPYERGDERRRVHWKATAHHGRLMVRESEGTGVVSVQIVVDLGPPGPHAEHVASVAAWVAAAAIDRGWLVRLVTLDAADVAPTLAVYGAPFGVPPTFAPPVVGPLPTVSAPVRNARDVRRRLATTAHGIPAVPGGGTANRVTCAVTPTGVVWS